MTRPTKRLKLQKKKPISLPWRVFVISIVGIAFFSITIFFLTLELSVQHSYAKSISRTTALEPKNLISDLPGRLKIPKINVDAAIEYVGLTPDGVVDIPKGPTNAAWFELGPRPGEVGSAVMIGHYGIWRSGVQTVFNNLYKLRKGDKLYVKDKKGVTTTFVVRESRIYDPKEDASEVFGSQDGKSHLNLITCDGVWNARTKQYSKRLVVFTDKEIKL